ncbi:hypothetical protein LSCM4_06349 [Leishmania orientalis]|uniref:Protein kinase domain-containing protein n=1 Tax=Leishmania orientalis TaxID=2249476 RepID=A0A836HYV3_9TRYP|nr:hypothetical protein LSCM4_06349 [Leishmania orientalis]
MDSASRASDSVCGPTYDGSRVFCVVCGAFSDDLVLRKSGLKCPTCVGKSASSYLAKLQKRHASHVLSQTLPVRSPSAGFDTPSSVPLGDGLRSHRMLSSESSSLPLTTEGYNNAAGTSETRSNTFRPIEEYISGTSVYRAVVKQAYQSRKIDRSAGGGSISNQQSLVLGAGGVTRSKSDTFSKDVGEKNLPSGSHPNAPSSAAAAGGATGEVRRAPPPLVNQRQATGNAQNSKSGPAKKPCDTVAERQSSTNSFVIPPTLTHTKDTERQERDARPPAQRSNAAPSRLPPRNGPCVKKSAPKPPPSLPGAAKSPADQNITAKSNGNAPRTSSLSRATASPAPYGAKVTSVTVHCPEGDEVMSDSWNCTFRGGRVSPVEATADTHSANPNAPRNDGAASPKAASRQRLTHALQMALREGDCASSSPLAMSFDAISNLPAPRAGSRGNSVASTATDRQSVSRLPVGRSHAGSSESTQNRRDAQAPTQRSSAATPSAAALASASARQVDERGATGTRMSKLSRMPRSSRDAAAVDDACRGGGSNRRGRRDEQSSRGASSRDSESSLSSGSVVASAISSSSVTVISSAPPEADDEGAAAAVKGTRTTRTQRSSVNPLGQHVNASTKKRVKKTAKACRAAENGGGERASHRLSAASLSGNIDALRIAVQLMPQLPPSAPEVSTFAPGGGDGALQTGMSSNDESSTTTGDTHSRTDSMRSGSSRTNDGYQRQVCTGGQSGRFTVTRHTRLRSGGSDAIGGTSGAAAASSASGASSEARRRRLRQQGSCADLTGAGALEVKKISYRLLIQDRHSGEVLLAKERRLYTDIIPALERVKMVAGKELPELPVKRLPSLRFATEGFMEERRVEVESFLKAVALSPFYIRHPDVVKLLGLEAYVADVVKLLGLEAYVAGRGSCGSATGARQPGRLVGAMNTGASPSPQGVADMDSTPQGRAGGGGGSRRSPGYSKGGRVGADATAASGPGERGAGYLSTDALNAYRASTTGGDGSGAGSGRGLCRTQSCSSFQTTCSSVVRRHKLDEVTMEDLEHTQLGNLIGRGTFGSVYLGLVQTHRGSLMVAVKVMRVGEAVAPAEMESLQRELDVLCAARHKNIIRFLGSSLNTTTRDLRVFTEYVECGTIRSLVDRFGALTMLAIQQYMQQILSGLQYLHSLSIAHRDIKGENILVTKNGRVKLSDFGSSTGTQCGVAAVGAAAAALPSNEGGGGSADSAGDGGLPVGSPQYMAPEVIQGTVKSVVAADIWSLGCVGIEMMDRPIWRESTSTNPFVFLYRISRSGTPPHGLPTDEELAALKAEGRVTECEGFSVYQDFLKSCLRVDPAQRPSASELLKHPFMTYPYSKHLRWMPPASLASVAKSS